MRSRLLETLGRNVQRYRNLRGWTMTELGERMGIQVSNPASYISNIERGNHSPSFERLEALARALGVTVSDLFDDGSQGDVSALNRLIRSLDEHDRAEVEDFARYKYIKRLGAVDPRAGDDRHVEP